MMHALIIFCALLAMPDTVTVARVVDGDTIVLSDSTRVRLIGINTPEMNKGNQRTKARQAKAGLDSLIGGRRVVLDYDSHGRADVFGRRLAYVRVDSLDVNLEMIRKGYSAPYLKYPFDRKMDFRRYGQPITVDHH